jgi:hypothetical protein
MGLGPWETYSPTWPRTCTKWAGIDKESQRKRKIINERQSIYGNERVIRI